MQGTTIAGRFVIESLAGTGAMGHVFRARDEVTSSTVALKVLAPTMGLKARDRFEREARVLQELEHPCIVRHVASGLTERNELYLAMEWLDGEDLAKRLDEGEMGLEHALRIGVQIAEALGVAHRRGIVHRDVKPSNLFLTGEDRTRVKVVDFGIAYWERTRWRPLTHDGALVGTPGYMAPEQGRGERVDARADVFALGCVLFEMVTGLPAFVADQTTALLLKILVQEVPLLGEVVEGVPEELEQLVATMLSKDPARRPRDGAEVARALQPIADEVSLGPVRRSWVSPSTRPPQMTGAEQRLLSVVLVSTPQARSVDPEATVAEEQAQEMRDRIGPIVAELDCRMEWLADGSVVAIVEGGAATDQAARAARCALAIRKVLGTLRTGIATGRGRVDERLPVGPVIDRVAALVSSPGPAVVRVDELTAGLLDARFVVGGDARGLVLEDEREGADEERTLLGRPTPYVGRAREQGMLEAVAAECVEEGVARAVLVTGPAGMGKSRLRRETVKRLARGEPPMMIWSMRADPLRRGSSFGVLSDALHRQAGIHDDEPIEVRQRKIRARAARYVPPALLPQIAPFLCEVVGAPLPQGDHVLLQTARRSSSAMADHVRRAMVELLEAECGAGPVALVLEDLQWADAPTVTLVAELLRSLADAPLLVLGFARPEIDDAFPTLWEGRDVTRIPLSPLTRRASEKLVRTVLGHDVGEEHVERLIELASGNPFLLEELVRAAAEGRWDDAPDTVIAVVQARLEALPGDLRRVLRAASVFGDSCWRGGLVALLGGQADKSIDDWLSRLVDQELLVPRPTSRFGDEPEYAFRHDLIREAAYAMLTDENRAAGHRIAGGWLEAKGESLPRVLAEHYERGGALDRAAEQYHRAAMAANAAVDAQATIELADHGIACGAAGELLGELLVAKAEALASDAEVPEWGRVAREGFSLLLPGSPSWYRAVRWVASAASRLQDVPMLEQLAGAVLEQPAEPNADRVAALARVATELYLLRLSDLAERVFAEMEAEATRLDDHHPTLLGLIHASRARRCHAANDRAGYAREMSTAARLFERGGDARLACTTLANLGFSLLEIGRPDESETVTVQALAIARRLGLSWIEALALHNMGLALAWLGRTDEARAAERRAIEMMEARGEMGRLLGGSYGYLATIYSLAGEPERAEEAARRAVAMLADMASTLPRAQAALAQALLAQGRNDEAREHASAAAGYLAREGHVAEGEGLIRLLDAETLLAIGDVAGARAAVEAAAERLRVRAARLEDGEAFLRSVPEHVRTLALAESLSRRPPV